MQEIYNAIIKQIVLDILRDSCINQICAEIDITSDDIIAEILKGWATRKQTNPTNLEKIVLWINTVTCCRMHLKIASILIANIVYSFLEEERM